MKQQESKRAEVENFMIQHSNIFSEEFKIENNDNLIKLNDKINSLNADNSELKAQI